MDKLQRDRYLKAMGIETWRQRINNNTDHIENSAATTTDSQNNWINLEKIVSQCSKCSLHKSRTQTVFGVGNQQADLLLVGEAPGMNEDKQGEPFVGEAGKLLDKMLKAINLDRQQVYIANVLKCRPPQNRDPKPEEVALCTPYLEQQIALLQPKLMVALGRVAAHYLLKTNLPLARLRGHIHHFGEQQTPLIATYHPAYLLRNPADKRKSYDDLLWIQQELSNKINSL